MITSDSRTQARLQESLDPRPQKQITQTLEVITFGADSGCDYRFSLEPEPKADYNKA